MGHRKVVGRRAGKSVGAAGRVAGVMMEGLEQRTLLMATPVLDWSAYLWGNRIDSPPSITIDGSGSVWVTGSTGSSDLGVGGFDTSYNGGYGDAFVAKINADGTLARFSYLGGSGDDVGSDIVVDSSGNIWVTGYTDSADFASGGFDTSYNGNSGVGWGGDVFVAKINADGSLAWSSYLGGSNNDWGASIAVDNDGSAWVTGSICSADVASGGFDTSHNGGYEDAFVAKINADGSLAWSSYLGGSGRDMGGPIAIDGSGNAWVTGLTDSADVASSGFDTSYNGGSYDAFVAKINVDGSLAWSSYLGGNGYDDGLDIAIDDTGGAWVTGATTSSGWASDGFDASYNDGCDAFVAKINVDGSLAWSSYLGGSGNDSGQSIAVDGSGNVWVTGYSASPGWVRGGFDTSYNGDNRTGIGADALVAKINSNGTMAWSSYWGGRNGDIGTGVAIDSSGNAWVTGYTHTFVPATESEPGYGTYDGFVAKISDTVPSDIVLSRSSIVENQPAGTVVGTLSTVDPVSRDTFTYSLVSGAGSNNNNLFTISGDQLVTNGVFDYDIGNRYSIRVRTADSVGLIVDKVFKIQIAPEPGSFGRKHSLLLSDTDNDVVTLRIRGGGEGVLLPDYTIVLTGTTAKSVLSITVKKNDAGGGDGLFHLSGITSDGPIKGINASAVVLSGQVRINTLNQSAGKASVSMKFRTISDADVRIQGMPVSAITVGGVVSGSRIVSTGSIGKFSVAALLDSDVLVGVATDFAGQFAGHDDFINTAAKLRSLTVTGQKLPKGSSHPASVNNSHISAPSVGTVSLVNVATSSDAIVHVLMDTGILKVSQTKLVQEEMVDSGTWKKTGERPGIWEVVG